MRDNKFPPEEYYNPFEASKKAEEQKKKRKQKRTRKLLLRVLTCLIAIAVILAAYLMLDISKVKSITVKGNVHLDKEYIIEKANINYNSRFILVIPFIAEYQLSSSNLISSSTVKHTWGGGIVIEVNEEKAVAYFKEGNKTYVLLADGKKVELTPEIKSCTNTLPFIADIIGDENLEKLAQGLSEVSDKVILKISEICNYQASYDANMYRLVMNDGIQVISDVNSLPLITNYLEILKSVKQNNDCIVFDSATNSAIATSCKWVDEEEQKAITEPEIYEEVEEENQTGNTQE